MASETRLYEVMRATMTFTSRDGDENIARAGDIIDGVKWRATAASKLEGQRNIRRANEGAVETDLDVIRKRPENVRLRQQKAKSQKAGGDYTRCATEGCRKKAVYNGRCPGHNEMAQAA